MIRPLVLAAALIAVPASAGSTPLDPGTPTGAAARDCLNTRLIRTTKIVDDRTLLFRIGKDWFRNDLPHGGCAGLRADRAFGYRTSNAQQLCSIDTITVIDPGVGTTWGSCGLGKFIPVKLAGR